MCCVNGKASDAVEQGNGRREGVVTQFPGHQPGVWGWIWERQRCREKNATERQGGKEGIGTGSLLERKEFILALFMGCDVS